MHALAHEISPVPTRVVLIDGSALSRSQRCYMRDVNALVMTTAKDRYICVDNSRRGDEFSRRKTIEKLSMNTLGSGGAGIGEAAKFALIEDCRRSGVPLQFS